MKPGFQAGKIWKSVGSLELRLEGSEGISSLDPRDLGRWHTQWLRVVWTCPAAGLSEEDVEHLHLLPGIDSDKCSMLRSIWIHSKNVRNHGSIG